MSLTICRMAALLSDNLSHQEEDHVQPGYFGITPPPGHLPEKTTRTWVDRPEQLLQAVTVLKLAPVVAADAEFPQGRSHIQGDTQTPSHRLALLQLAVDRYCYVVDTLRLNDLSPLADVVTNPNIIVLLHCAGADIRVMAERGLVVAHYIDLEAASRSIFGQHESSLAAMLRRAFNARLDKTLQRTDWTRRPLPPAMIAYAARDAEVTLALYHWLDQHYHTILQSQKNTGLPDPIAAWIEPFLSGTATTSAEIAVVEAKARGLIKNNEQICTDCQAALYTITHPLRRNRLLRLISDLSLVQLAPDLLPFLQAETADERAGTARTLGR